MEQKTTVSFFVKKALEGNFHNITQTINEKQLILESGGCVKIIVAVCNICHMNISNVNKVNEKELEVLVKCLITYINEIPIELFQKYVQSVFHILIFLIKKKCYQTILNLEGFLLPHFMPTTIQGSQYVIYENIYKSIFNVIIDRVKEKNPAIYKMGFLLVKLSVQLGPKKNLLECLYKIVLVFLTSETEENLLELYKEILRLHQVSDDTLPTILNIFSKIYTQFLTQDSPLLNQTYNLTINYLNKHQLIEILKIIKHCNDLNGMTIGDIEKSHSALKKYNGEALSSVCNLISSIFSTLLLKYKVKNIWSDRHNIHIFLYKLLADIASKTKMTDGIRSLNSIGGLAKLALSTNPELSRTYKLEVYKNLEKMSRYIKCLKSNDNEKWQKSWFDLGSHLYSIGFSLNRVKDTENALMFLKKFVQDFVEFNSEPIIGPTYFSTALTTISDLFLELKDFDQCLYTLSVAIILNKNSMHEMVKWMKAKSMDRTNTELQQVTLISALKKFDFVPETYLNLDEGRKIELLIYELRQYCALWQSKIPMISVFRELSQMASVQICADTFIEIWGDCDLVVHESFQSLLLEMVKKVQKSELPKKEMYLAHLYFIKHKYGVKETLLENAEEMERTMTVPKPPTSELLDPNDECDIVSSYSHLQFSAYLKMMKDLNRALSFVQNFSDLKQEKGRLFKLLINMGHEFHLHLNKAKALKAWLLALKVTENEIQFLQTTSYIIEITDVRKSEIKKLMERAEKNIASLPDSEVVEYYLSKSKAFFDVDLEFAYNTFRQALDLKPSNDITKARLYLQHHHFLTRMKTKEFTLVKIHLALNLMNEYYSNSKNKLTSYKMRIFFDIYECVTEMYDTLLFPRDVRCYAKDGALVAQKMVLPLRTARLLFYLAKNDIKTWNFDSANIKIRDLSEILGVPSNSTSCLTPQKREIELNGLVGDFVQLMLDVPKPVRGNPGSPRNYSDGFKLPTFLHHEDGCDCFACCCFEYQELIMRRYYLSGLLFEYENNVSTSIDFLFGAMKIYEILTKKKTDLLVSLEDKMADFNCVCLLEYTNILLRNQEFVEADKILSRLEESKRLQPEVMVQKLNLIYLQEPPEEGPPPQDHLMVDTEICTIKTPPNNIRKICVSPKIVPRVKSIANIPIIKLNFDKPMEEAEKVIEVLPKVEQTPAPPSVKSKKVLTEITDAPPSSTNKPPSNNLASRTKLLTERLKNKQKGSEENEGRTRVRQNLMKQLEESADVELRRSRRVKK